MRNENELVEEIFMESPLFHKGETEIPGKFKLNDSFLNKRLKGKIYNNDEMCYGIGREVAFFIMDSVKDNFSTMEIGSGVSTLIFAIKATNHIAITPSEFEVEKIKDYASRKDISLKKVTFYNSPSEDILPKLKLDKLDFIFIDGKHSFPWPIVDWFYSVDFLKQDGIILIDDAQIKAVRILIDFMEAEKGWVQVYEYKRKIYGFKKLFSDSIKEFAWHMQNFNRNKSLKNRLKMILQQIR